MSTNKTTNYHSTVVELNLQNTRFISQEKKNKVRTSGNLFSQFAASYAYPFKLYDECWERKYW